MKCDKLKRKYSDITGPYYGYNEVNEAIAELKDKCQMHDFFWEGCGFAKRGFKNTIAVSEAFDRLEAENAELKKKLMPCLNGDCILTCEVVEKYGKENAELKARIQLDDDEMEGFLQLEEECGGGDLRNYIAELKAELAEKDKDIAYWREEYDKETKLTDALKDEIESLKASHYNEMVDAGMRERRLKRALWMARAERAIEKQTHFALCHNHSIDLYMCINGASMPTDRNTTMRQPSEWSMIWKKVAIKCRAKAEEYK